MDHETYLAHMVEQGEAFRAAAVAAGPAATVPTCPKWTVADLVAHLGGVHNMVRGALRLKPDDARPASATPPTGWPDLLDWADEQRLGMISGLSSVDPSTQVWGFVPGLGSVGWWGRRQAHELAIHRLDAEHALGSTVPPLGYDPAFAADGIDEVVAMIAPFRARLKRPEVTVEGTLLVHAADAGRAWLVTVSGGALQVRAPVDDPGTDADATLAGTADAVYRAVWKRPSTAILTGRDELLQAVNAG
ncbi:MAG: maleylpyruvate isomerase family mycothiol-dependent enzyme [Kibdelosporangium sp.]